MGGRGAGSGSSSGGSGGPSMGELRAQGLRAVPARPTRSTAPFDRAFERVGPARANDLATGRIPIPGSRQGSRFEPVKVHVQRSGALLLSDGNHRLAAARRAGATRIRATFELPGGRTRTMVVPIV